MLLSGAAKVKIVYILAPPGSGKTTISNLIKPKVPGMKVSLDEISSVINDAWVADVAKIPDIVRVIEGNPSNNEEVIHRLLEIADGSPIGFVYLQGSANFAKEKAAQHLKDHPDAPTSWREYYQWLVKASPSDIRRSYAKGRKNDEKWRNDAYASYKGKVATPIIVDAVYGSTKSPIASSLKKEEV